MIVTNVAIFASGTGTNAAKIIDYFKDSNTIKIVLLVSNKADSGVLTIAKNNLIPTLIIEKENFLNGDGYLPFLKHLHIHFLVLAGFLWKVPQILIQAYPKKIINIHPSLLPKYGGKGMYGANIHQAVIDNKEIKSGITIHFVNEEFDEGEHLLQATVEIEKNETAESLAHKIHRLEHFHFSRIIEWVVCKTK